MNFHTGRQSGEIQVQLQVLVPLITKSFEGPSSFCVADCCSWVTSCWGPEWLSSAFLYASPTHPSDLFTAQHSPAVGPEWRSAWQPTAGTSSSTQQGLRKLSEGPAPKFPSPWPTAAGARPIECGLDTHSPLPLARPSLTVLECAAQYAFLKSNQGVIHLLYVCSAEQEAEASGTQEELGNVISNSWQPQTETLSLVTAL